MFEQQILLIFLTLASVVSTLNLFLENEGTVFILCYDASITFYYYNTTVSKEFSDPKGSFENQPEH